MAGGGAWGVGAGGFSLRLKGSIRGEWDDIEAPVCGLLGQSHP